MTDARAAFTAAAVRWAAGGDPVALVDAAAQALADGLDGPTLRRLAGARRADAGDEADALAPAAFEELDLAIAPWGSPAAIDAGGWQVLRDLLDGEVTPRDAARRLGQACRATGYGTDLSAFAGYEEEYELVETGVLPGPATEVDEDLRRHAAEHLADRPVAHAGARPLPLDGWYRLGGWMVVAHDPGVAL